MNYYNEKIRADRLQAKLANAEHACRLSVARCQELEYQYMVLQHNNAVLRQAIEETYENENLGITNE